MDKTIKKKKDIKIIFNKIITYLQKPEHAILVFFGIFMTLVTIAPIITLLVDTFIIKPGSYAAFITGRTSGLTIVNWTDLLPENRL